MKPIILPKDGCKSAAHLISELTLIMSTPGISELVGLVKVNDGNFKFDMSAPCLGHSLRTVAEVTGTSYGIFNDLKTGDVSGTLKNISACFKGLGPQILTVSAIIATKGFLEIKRMLADTQIALFSVPTDMSVDECKAKNNGMSPGEKILFDIEFYMEQWERVTRENEIKQSRLYQTPFDLVVCSPRELDYLNDSGMEQYFGWVCPGIRDEWMVKDHQERTTGVREALEKGAMWVVMTTQILKGSPKNGISAEESRQRTLAEIQKFQAEMI